MFNIKYQILNNRKSIELSSSDHYPTKYRSLRKYFDNINDDTYFIDNFESNYNINIKDEFVIIHLDEKFNDIIDITHNIIGIKSVNKYIELLFSVLLSVPIKLKSSFLLMSKFIIIINRNPNIIL